MRIAILEKKPSKVLNMPIYMGVVKEPYYPHADIMAEYLKRLGPDHELDLLPNNSIGMKRLLDGDYQIAVMSSKEWFYLADFEKAIENEVAKKVLLVTSAGNTGNYHDKTKRVEAGAAARSAWVAIGACDHKGTPRDYSSYGGWKIFGVGMDQQFDDLSDAGTSFSDCDWTAKIMWFYEKYKSVFGHYPSPEQAKNWAKINSHDVWDEGIDLKTGYGLLKLPRVWRLSEMVITLGSNQIIFNDYEEIDAVGRMIQRTEDLEEPIFLSDHVMYREPKGKVPLPKWRYYGPLRFSGESIGSSVYWDEDNNQAHFGRF